MGYENVRSGRKLIRYIKSYVDEATQKFGYITNQHQMKLTETKLRKIIREELKREYSSSISQHPTDYSNSALIQEKIYEEIVSYLDRNGQQAGKGWNIGGIHVTIKRGNEIRIMWHHGEGEKAINQVKISPDGKLSFRGSGGSTPRSMPDYYDHPKTIIDLLQSDKKTVSNYPT